MTENIKVIKESLKATRDKQKSYADNHRKALEFEVGDKVFLKLSPWKGVIRFGRKGKLSPLYIGSYEILEHVGKEQVLRTKVIPMVEIMWNNHGVKEATWENEEPMKAKYPQLFALTS
ncbi:reverse transcriptase [Cucumis melo var. makuwa]|uniref:Reverse transcriptase n=1 Tax=Cucumis melo var. makuwa TaxID=1194695 RepID=A0A5A7UIE0_CUCMM|nr:reverse transcriptase [Cucumis melo var. makuwa]TYK22723.1 reverse transcriptase [Cucumis melo var. makuwa]